ncbi:MAG: hypothetical protein UZ16_OP3001001640 [Candidatus Hinthialibacteria bacterium OLB16]|nr:MAG: hypothetical protein UZ16_OP3001001640 [Candidatus Hinthialibacteria bacterium OLB16]
MRSAHPTQGIAQNDSRDGIDTRLVDQVQLAEQGLPFIEGIFINNVAPAGLVAAGDDIGESPANTGAEVDGESFRTRTEVARTPVFPQLLMSFRLIPSKRGWSGIRRLTKSIPDGQPSGEEAK